MIRLLFLTALIATACHKRVTAAKQVGGISNNNDNPELIKIAVDLLNENIEQLAGTWVLDKVLNLSSQIVAGTNWIIDGIFTETDEDKRYRLIVNIYNVPWESYTEVSLLKQEPIN